MKVQILLADKGTQNPQAGTLNLLNVGWSQTGLSSPAPGVSITPAHAVAVFYEVEPHHCNHPIDLLLELVTQDGHEVQLPGPAGPQPMRVTQQITIPSPGGAPSGTPGSGNTLLEVQPGLPLSPGGYEWRVTLAGEHREEWSASFRVVAPPNSQPVFGTGSPAPS